MITEVITGAPGEAAGDRCPEQVRACLPLLHRLLQPDPAAGLFRELDEGTEDPRACAAPPNPAVDFALWGSAGRR